MDKMLPREPWGLASGALGSPAHMRRSHLKLNIVGLIGAMLLVALFLSLPQKQTARSRVEANERGGARDRGVKIRHQPDGITAEDAEKRQGEERRIHRGGRRGRREEGNKER